MLRQILRISLFVCMAPLCGCAYILEGAHQSITVNTEPQGATCTFERHGKTLGTIYTPATIKVSKSHESIAITCRKPGYDSLAGVDESHNEGWIFGNLVFGGGIGTIVDLGTAADDAYGEKVTVKLKKID